MDTLSSIVTVRMVITVSYTILPSSWISDVNFVAECMYLVVGTKACTVWHAICCKIAAVAAAAASSSSQQ